jgi:hypothetical protein
MDITSLQFLKQHPNNKTSQLILLHIMLKFRPNFAFYHLKYGTLYFPFLITFSIQHSSFKDELE